MTDPLIPEFDQLMAAFRHVHDFADVKGRHIAFDVNRIEDLHEVHIHSYGEWASCDVLAYGTCHLPIVHPVPQHKRDGVFVPDRISITSSRRCWFVLEAWSDDTGWECQGSGGHIRVADSLEDLARFGMSRETRLTFGLLLGDD